MLGASSQEAALGSSSQVQGSSESLRLSAESSLGAVEFLVPPKPDGGVLPNPLVACLNELYALRTGQTAPESIYSYLRNRPLCIEKEGEGIPRKCVRGSRGSGVVVSTGWCTPELTRMTQARPWPLRLQGLQRAAAVSPAEPSHLGLQGSHLGPLAGP